MWSQAQTYACGTDKPCPIGKADQGHFFQRNVNPWVDKREVFDAYGKRIDCEGGRLTYACYKKRWKPEEFKPTVRPHYQHSPVKDKRPPVRQSDNKGTRKGDEASHSEEEEHVVPTGSVAPKTEEDEGEAERPEVSSQPKEETKGGTTGETSSTSKEGEQGSSEEQTSQESKPESEGQSVPGTTAGQEHEEEHEETNVETTPPPQAETPSTSHKYVHKKKHRKHPKCKEEPPVWMRTRYDSFIPPSPCRMYPVVSERKEPQRVEYDTFRGGAEKEMQTFKDHLLHNMQGIIPDKVDIQLPVASTGHSVFKDVLRLFVSKALNEGGGRRRRLARKLLLRQQGMCKAAFELR
ncbi:hypothetical protein GUITHDRAFT_115591 [Guillardia theta CCMP2712]|uniref:Uncharacterized protein n=1 Tax=Guillardia theta (strain CCMP2712) TaxID=905079 RepID=L1IQU4_GUITC|nr:hypothetical protein GUITHDRAFT_115591 [Guillardia theta CCMP2712]EKX38249.1 hypothetical protein GUITHDRAFT_115591 [Guillardia theta CCMP2712]|eukprot:XP_005825229.1 hypothetical protein GUITHDRAFT_115591 [Guillardia theta CCMP2712]